jgi:hypothetical protein
MNLGKIGSVGKLAGGFTGVVGQLDGIVKAAKGLLCLPVLLSKFNLTSTKNLVKNAGSALAGIASSLGNMVAEAVADRVNALVNTAVGAAQSVLSTVQSVITSLKNLVGYIKLLGKKIENIKQTKFNFKDTLKDVKQKAVSLKQFHFNTQNCAVHASNFLNCVLSAVANKVTGALLSKLNNPLRKIDSKLVKIQKDITNSAFQANGLIQQYAGRHIQTAEKLAKQITILAR